MGRDRKRVGKEQEKSVDGWEKSGDGQAKCCDRRPYCGDVLKEKLWSSGSDNKALTWHSWSLY